ncbi:ATP-binding protein [Nonomuraea jabiensis]|uniref:Histidine kinase/HSP90-like ATPase domain-containing protein n=1 Tax=Nonomuraea jabiensis TaxID=882448 RepID=A0A7W9G7F2_9ACTN|nr:hypothetical protein [Nonomuraea jabiensis]
MKTASAEPRVIGSIRLVGIRESVSHARSEVRKWLGDDHPSVDDVVLAASELVTNALRHSDARPYDLIGLTVTAAEGMVYVEVLDPGSMFSAPHIRQEPEAVDGRGLLIIRETPRAGECESMAAGLVVPSGAPSRPSFLPLIRPLPKRSPDRSANAALAERNQSGPRAPSSHGEGEARAAEKRPAWDLPPASGRAWPPMGEPITPSLGAVSIPLGGSADRAGRRVRRVSTCGGAGFRSGSVETPCS